MKLTPESSIEALEKRFELGELTKGDECWNATKNQEQLDNDTWVWDRMAHGFEHLKHYADVRWYELEDNGDDDGAAIMWLGCMLHEAYMRRKANESAHKGMPNPAEEVQASPLSKRLGLSREEETRIRKSIEEIEQTRKGDNSAE